MLYYVKIFASFALLVKKKHIVALLVFKEKKLRIILKECIFFLKAFQYFYFSYLMFRISFYIL